MTDVIELHGQELRDFSKVRVRRLDNYSIVSKKTIMNKARIQNKNYDDKDKTLFKKQIQAAVRH